jgi:hypothetical protein
MKKRFAVSIIAVSFFCMVALPSNARTITQDEATTAAGHHLVKLGKSLDYSLKTAGLIRHDDLTYGYVFELNPQGYIIVSSETGLPPVIAYSFESNFGDPDPSNPLFRLITRDLTGRMKRQTLSITPERQKNEESWKELLEPDRETLPDSLFEQWPASGDGWLKTNWTQTSPYNAFCPMDPVTETRSYAGCPATAMAQIMNFHQTTNNTHFNDPDDYFHNYAGRQYWIDDDHDMLDFPSFPELNAYLDTLNDHYFNNSALSNNDKAALTFACGVAAKQVFTSQGSGTFGVSQAYEAYLRFGCDLAELLDSNDSDLFEKLKQNMKDTLPAHLAVVDSSWSTGHNVVVDGYNTEDYYHLNFGWGGSYNGWYLLPQEIPYNLTVIEGVVLDIMKYEPTGILVAENPSSTSYILPNPLSGKGLLQYQLYRSSAVNIHFYNASGIEILRIEPGEQSTGKYSYPFDLSNLPAGLYFYEIQAGPWIDSGKMIKIK